MKTRNIIIASSGTAGHIYPGIVLAEEFKKNEYNPILFISNNAVSVEISKNSGFERVLFNISGMPRKISFSFIPFLFKISFSFFKALKQIINTKPLAVIGMGGYIAVPVILAAKILNKRTFIHEQNVLPGKANILLNKITNKTFISFQISEKYFKNKNTIFSGYPIRKNLLSLSKEKALQEFKFSDKILTILIFGGSIGSAKLNEVACETFSDSKFQILHITGLKNHTKVLEKIKDNPTYKVFEYMHNINIAYSASDIVVCRAGAGTIFELKALNKPTILVPYPYATGNHQSWNAKEMEKHGKAMVIEDKNLNKESLGKAISALENITDKTTGNITILPQELIYKEIIKCIKS
jgi:UDP-N-acetylglucosamine--N-acetylmuramyl-(pentapeptide) pyrophosphoryl-undecaprenol N-acetylglucosamine transferase